MYNKCHNVTLVFARSPMKNSNSDNTELGIQPWGRNQLQLCHEKGVSSRTSQCEADCVAATSVAWAWIVGQAHYPGHEIKSRSMIWALLSKQLAH